MKTAIGEYSDGRTSVMFFCPGCNVPHAITVGTWTWNGDRDAPTFSPSLLSKRWGYPYGIDPEPDETQEPSQQICHNFVTDGKIQFLTDSTHHLAGQTVEIPEWPYGPDGSLDED